MSKKPSFPWWLKYANRLVILLNQLGLSIGTMHILSIPGRKTGKMRSTPVSVLRVNGERYILTELPVEERPAILREFPVQVPGGVKFFERLLDLPNDPETFAQAAPQCPVFRLDYSDTESSPSKKGV